MMGVMSEFGVENIVLIYLVFFFVFFFKCLCLVYELLCYVVDANYENFITREICEHSVNIDIVSQKSSNKFLQATKTFPVLCGNRFFGVLH